MRIALVSNSFGAMYIGHVLKSLLAYDCSTECRSYNVFFAQNRAVEDAIYNGDHSHHCAFLEPVEFDLTDVQAIFVVDDSIFTGNSFVAIRDYLKSKTGNPKCSIHLLPLTLNCDCLKNCSRGIRPEEDRNEIAHRAVALAQQVGETLPPFLSFWDFARTAPENSIYSSSDEVNQILHGNDWLLKHLWARFESQILSE